MTKNQKQKPESDKGNILFYALVLFVGFATIISGRVHATNYGPTEGSNVRIGGMFAVAWAIWGFWKIFKKRKDNQN